MPGNSEKKIISAREADVRGKRVLLRTSLNLPITAEGSVGDVYRLKRTLPTIALLAERGAKIILVGYIGRDGGTLEPVARALQKLLPHVPVAFTKTPAARAGEEVARLKEGACLMLENIRLEPGEEKDDAAFAKALASLADVFVDDAFAEAHRPYASNLGVAKLLPAYAGLLLKEEVTKLTEALTPPPGALAIVGGAKFETKEPLLKKMLEVYPKILLGGALANDLLKARGFPVGASLSSEHIVPPSLAQDAHIIVPSDLVVESNGHRNARTADVRAGEHIVDIGEETAKEWAGAIVQASFVLWNGPMGVYEKGYTQGTDALAQALAGAHCRAVIGGGDTEAALAHHTFDPSRIFVSTGGGAMLEFLANGGHLPAIDVLKA